MADKKEKRKKDSTRSVADEKIGSWNGDSKLRGKELYPRLLPVDRVQLVRKLLEEGGESRKTRKSLWKSDGSLRRGVKMKRRRK